MTISPALRTAVLAGLLVIALVAVPVAVLGATGPGSGRGASFCDAHPRAKRCLSTIANSTSSSASSTSSTPASSAPPSTAPTSKAPTSAPPTSKAPTSAPTSSAPTSSAPTSTAPTSTSASGAALPAQPAAIFYGKPGQWNSVLDQYAHPGAMVVAGRDNYQDQGFKDVSAAGGSVLVYLDAIVWNDYGTYHHLLFDDSSCGAAVPQWPGPVTANGTGNLADFRTTADGGNGILQGKLRCVLEQMVKDNPQMTGFFMDDLGSRSWFGGFNWSTWGAANQQAYRDGAVAIAETVRQVADAHHLIYLVNGTWQKGTLASAGGGYPDPNVDGLSLADGGVVEHHDGQSSFFGPYGCGAQWATASAVTKGTQYMFDISSSSAGVAEYSNTQCYAWVANQASTAYDGVAPYSNSLWHANGLS